MENFIFLSDIQNGIEEHEKVNKGILQLKDGALIGDIYIWNDGAWYYGESKNTYAHGNGVQYDIDRNDYCRYVGGFKNGKYHGYGKYRHFNGEYYDGEWRNNNRHGKGTIIYSNGDMFSGQWYKHYREGIGVYIYNRPRKRTKGFKAFWKNDRIAYYIELLQ